MTGSFRVETARLKLRPFETGDVRALARIGGDPRVASMVFVPTSPWPEEDVRIFISDAVFRGAPGFRVAIALKDGTLIGTIGLSASAEVYYFLHPDHWNAGYGSEAVVAFIAACFDQFDLTEVSARVFTDNPVSKRLLERHGFEHAGFGMQTSGARVEPAPVSLYRLSRSTFEACHEVS